MNEYKVMAQKLARTTRPDWSDESRYQTNPEEEIKKAFIKMTDEQLQFHLTIPGKNHEYAKAILEHRKKLYTTKE